MNNAKHTPGPWVILKGYDGTVEVSASRPYRINNISAGTPLICDVYQHPEFDGFSSQANANLIASAPDLLESLKEMTALLDKVAAISGFPFREPINGSPCAKARAAIAKATGAALSDAQAAQGGEV